MNLSRREFVQLLGIASASGMLPTNAMAARNPAAMYDQKKFGNVCLMHMTDCHAQLNPIYFREPNVNIGVGGSKGKAPHIVGDKFLEHFKIKPGTIEAHAFTYLDYDKAAKTYGKVGGFAHLSTLVKKVRADRGEKNCLLLDGGDTWQGSATAYWTRGKDMVGATNLLGVDVMTGHWEFTYPDIEMIDNVRDFKGDFVAQNVRVKEDVLFDYKFADFSDFNEDTGAAFKPYTIKNVNGVKVAVIGQAFPYTPIANPKRFIPDWTFGINDESMQEVVDQVRSQEKPAVVVVISHNGMDVDLKMASRVTGIDVIFGGHTHDGVPQPSVVKNPGGKTLVTNAGSNGKFLGVMDLDVRKGKVQGFRYRLMPVFSNLLEADAEMFRYIEKVRAPYRKQLRKKLAVADQTLYRRGNFNGTFDQVICDALREVNDAEISLSPGFRWGTTVLGGQSITFENVMDQTCITYPNTYRREMTGDEIKVILEDIADNLYNTDPYYQQGGDMVRVAGIDYTLAPNNKIGSRVSDVRLDNGKKLEASKKYTVSGWASVNSIPDGKPIWDVVSDYLKDKKTVKIKKMNVPKLVGVKGNPGLSSYGKV